MSFCFINYYVASNIFCYKKCDTLLFKKKKNYSVVSVDPGKYKYIVPCYFMFLKGDLYFPFQMWFL